ncbi:hypothetical protein CerSpe_137190 [Prunus speciosa]
MKSLKFFLVLAKLVALSPVHTLSVSATSYEFEESFFNDVVEEDNNNVANETFDDLPVMSAQGQEKTSLRGTSRFLASHRATAATCDKNPKVCKATHAHCCHNNCVDLKTDKLNCGNCGVKSHHAQICCKGHLVNPMSDKTHCGGCNNHCKKGGSCAFGMCSYA